MSTVNTSNIAGFFKDPAGSDIVTLQGQQIAAPLVRGQVLTNDEMSQGGGMRVVMLAFDASPSMIDVGDELRNGFNTEFVPAVKAARQDDISALRIGGIAFSSRINPIWEGKDEHGKPCYFHSLDKLPQLSTAEYDPSQGSGTALHQAMIDATTRAMLFASEIESQTGIAPDVDVLWLTDGANNCKPMDPSGVRQMITAADKNRVRFTFLYFETGDGLKDPRQYALDLGVDGENIQAFMKKANEDQKEYRRRFRRLMQVISRVSANRGTSAVQATAAVTGDLV